MVTEANGSVRPQAEAGSAHKECTAGVSPNNSEDKIIILLVVI